MRGGVVIRAWGDAGADEFRWSADAQGRNVVQDFEDGVDKIGVSSGQGYTAEDALAAARQEGGNVVISRFLPSLDEHSTLIIHSFNIANLSLDDFV